MSFSEPPSSSLPSSPPVVPPPPVGQSLRPELPGHLQANLRAERAGFGVRLVASIIDGILYGFLSSVFVAVGVVMIVAAYSNCTSIAQPDGVTETICPPGEPNSLLILLGIAVMVVSSLLVAGVYIRGVAKLGQTWGKRIVGIKIVSQNNGDVPGYGNAILRILVWCLSYLCCYLGHLWMFWDKQKQTWHDKAAETVVIVPPR